jgi:hypothetical protein
MGLASVGALAMFAYLSAVSTNETDSGFPLTEGFGLIAVT